MKKNTIQILLSSFSQSSADQEKNLRGYQFYYDLFSDMTDGGVRSVVYQLVEKGFLKRLVLNGQSFFSITDAGISQLGLLLPGLKIKERKKGDTKGWLLILLSAPKLDPHFLKLHQVMNKHLFKSVIRGVYFYPFSAFPESLFELVLTRYSSSLSLVEVKNFSLAIPDSKNNPLIFKKKLSEISSRLSSQAQLLIDSKNNKNSLIYQSKKTISDTFSFISEYLMSDDVLLLEDKGVKDEFFQMLIAWNSLIQLVYFSQ